MELKPDYRRTKFGWLPADWAISEIGELKPFVTSGSRGWATYYSDRGALFVRITNLTRESIYLDLEDVRFVDLPPTANEGTRTQLSEHDILISITADIGIIGYVDKRVPQPAYINQHIALVRFDPLKTNGRFVSYFLASERPQKLFRAATDNGAKAGMSLLTVQKLEIALPSFDEQCALAEALRDVDVLLEYLSKLIAKKHDLKQAAMQQLLTGQTRLPGFHGEWKRKLLGNIAHIKTGSRNNENKVEDGLYPFFVRSEIVERINSYSHDCEAILVPGEGRIGSIFHYIRGKFDVHQRVYAITQFKPHYSGRFIHLYLSKYFGVWAMQNTVKATVDSLRLPTFQTFEVRLPPTLEEQTVIAAVLSDMDAEIADLKARRDKTRLLKQGMTQELLTGKIRLL